MSVRAKFVINTITRSLYGGYSNQSHKSETREVHSIKMFPVSSGPGEDEQFWASTPSGSIELNVVNPAAVEQFANMLGRKVYVDFTPAED